MKHILVLAKFAARRKSPEWTEHRPFMDQGSFVAMSGLSTRPEGPTAQGQLRELGWSGSSELNTRQLVLVDLPASITDGSYRVAGTEISGLHGPHSARDGMGSTVYAYVGSPAPVEASEEAAFSAAIASGIYLSVPGEDGERHSVQLPILDVSPIFEAFKDPYPWKALYDELYGRM